MPLTFSQYSFIERIFQAFTVRDLQTAVTIATWMGHNEVGFDDLVGYLAMRPKMAELYSVGYFNPNPSAEQARQIRAVEKTFPVEMRREMRRVRLQNTKVGPSHE